MNAQDALDLLNHAGTMLAEKRQDCQRLDKAYDLILQAMWELEKIEAG